MSAVHHNYHRFFAELPDVCGTGGVIDREIVQWIKNNRNVWAHIEDGQSLTTEECGRLLPEARPRVGASVGRGAAAARWWARATTWPRNRSAASR